jgi:hypothetical protein
MTIHDLSDDVLLEIFDLYRQTFGDQLKVWNNKNGWFKLVHVCHNWRSVVLASPSRLQLRLYFAGDTTRTSDSTNALVIERLLHLPIIVDFLNVSWCAGGLERLISALRYPDRVSSIGLVGSYNHMDLDKIAEALDLPFPTLESLELRSLNNLEPVLSATSLMTSIRSLRHLRLFHVYPPCIFQLLSVTRTLVDLTLLVSSVFYQTNGASLLTHLQHMPHLRNLQMTTFATLSSIEEKPPIITVLLAELTCFHFFGDCAQTEWFVAGFDTPSLREFHITAVDLDARGISHTFDIPYLSKFIRVTGVVFLAARLTISGPSLTTSLFTHPHSIDDPPSKAVRIETQSDPGSALSAMLATIEDIFLFLPIPIKYCESYEYYVPWREFPEVFNEFRSVKVLRLHHGLETQLVDILRQPAMNFPLAREEVGPDATMPSDEPVDGNRNRFTLDIFPSLEEIVVYSRTPDTSIDKKERPSGIESFEPFATERYEVGRPVKVSWGADGEVPKYVMTNLWHPEGN